MDDALSRPSLRPGLHRSPAARYRYLHAPPLTACFPRGQLQQQVQRHAQRGTCTHRTLPPTRPSFSSSLFCAPAALFPSPSPKQTQSQSLQNIYFSPPGAKKEKNPTELLGLQVLLDLPPPSLGLCENLKLNPDTCHLPPATCYLLPATTCYLLPAQTPGHLELALHVWPADPQPATATAARRPVCLLRPELQSAATSRRGISRA